jgi:predicted DNA-binding protein YlxM (UPF0122 family)
MPGQRALNERLATVRLIEVYGNLLTLRQLRLLRMYYLNDFSLGEIAEKLEITRQAVFDSLQRSVDELTRLESSLHLLAAADEEARLKTLLATRLDALEQTVQRLRGRVDPTTLGEISAQLASLRRTCL